MAASLFKSTLTTGWVFRALAAGMKSFYLSLYFLHRRSNTFNKGMLPNMTFLNHDLQRKYNIVLLNSDTDVPALYSVTPTVA